MNKKVIIGIIVVVVALAAIGVAYWYFFMRTESIPPTPKIVCTPPGGGLGTIQNGVCVPTVVGTEQVADIPCGGLLNPC